MADFTKLFPRRRQEQVSRATQRDVLPNAVKNASMGATVIGTRMPIIDQNGLASVNNFTGSQSAFASINQSFTTTSYVDVTGTSLTFTLTRQTLMLFFITVYSYLVESVGNTGDGVVVMDIDGTTESGLILFNSGNNFLDTRSVSRVLTLEEGEHTIKLKGKLGTIHAGSPSMTIAGVTLTYLKLGD